MHQKTSEKSLVTLRVVTKDTVNAVCRLSPNDDQKQFVASNAQSIAEAYFEPDYAWFRALYADETPVGFVMLGIDPEQNFVFLWRLMIDKKYQNLGFGKRSLELVLDSLKSQTRITHLVTSYHPGNGDPSGFYKSLGFKEVDDKEDWGELGDKMKKLGETRLALRITR